MTNKDLDELLLAYETDTRFPDVSGVEHLDMWWYLDVLAFAWPQIQPVHTAILQPV